MTHTQGQWQLHSPTEGNPKTNDGTYCITGSHGGGIAKIIPEDSPETPANATLISASPAMLSALQALLREKALEGGGDPDDFDWVRSADADPAGTWQAAYQAIAKATEEVTA